MARGRRQAQRVFVAQPLAHGVTIACDPGQRNYLLNVLRLTDGDAVHVFNGVDGEWHAVLRTPSRKVCALEPVEQRRAQTDGPELTLAFAPLKRDRLDYLVQKATELGVRAICPVMTERVQTQRLKLDRLEANVIEAAEQCGVLRIPSVASPVAFDDFLAARGDDDDDDGAGDGGEVAQAARTGGAVEASITAQTVASGRRSLVFCDEAAEVANPIAALSSLVLPLTVLIGPEGGFSPRERDRLLARADTCAISLGPRIMRADTAVVAALALVNAVVGDWQ